MVIVSPRLQVGETSQRLETIDANFQRDILVFWRVTEVTRVQNRAT